MSAYTYIVCGVALRTSFPIPELVPAVVENADLDIREGAVPLCMPLSKVQSEGWFYGQLMHFQSTDTGILLVVTDIGRIWLGDDGRMEVERLPGVQEAEMSFYILGSVLGLFLIRRGAFPIHGSTVTGSAGSILFCGASGAGKSTISTWFMDQGYALVADDVSLVYFSESGNPKVWPGIPQVKLWDDSALALQRDPEALPLLLENWEKRRLPVAASTMAVDASLTAIVLLLPESCETPDLRLLSGTDRFTAIAGNIFRGEAIQALGQAANHFGFSSRLAALTPVYALRRPRDRFALKEIQELVEHQILNKKAL